MKTLLNNLLTTLASLFMLALMVYILAGWLNGQ